MAYRLEGAINLNLEADRFLLPIFSLENVGTHFTTISEEGVIVQFLPVEIENSELLTVDKRRAVRVGEPEIIAYRKSAQMVIVGTALELETLLQKEVKQSIHESPELAVQASYYLGANSTLNVARQLVINSLAQKDSYANSVAREAGWSEIERLIGEDQEQLAKFKSTKGCYDFSFGSSGNIMVNVFTDDPIDETVIESARTSIGVLLADLSPRGEQDFDYRGQLELPFSEWFASSIGHLYLYPRQETRLAVIVRHLALSPSEGVKLLNNYKDKGSHTNRSIDYLLRLLRNSRHGEKLSGENFLEYVLPVIYDNAPARIRVKLMEEFAKYLSDFPLAVEFILEQVNESEKSALWKNRNSITKYLER